MCVSHFAARRSWRFLLGASEEQLHAVTQPVRDFYFFLSEAAQPSEADLEQTNELRARSPCSSQPAA